MVTEEKDMGIAEAVTDIDELVVDMTEKFFCAVDFNNKLCDINTQQGQSVIFIIVNTVLHAASKFISYKMFLTICIPCPRNMCL